MKPPSTVSAWSSAAGPADRQLEEGEPGEELVVGDVVEQGAQAGADRLRRLGARPFQLGREASGGDPQRVGGEGVEAGDEGLVLAGEVVVEGLVGDAGGGRDRRDAERFVAVLDAERRRG